MKIIKIMAIAMGLTALTLACVAQEEEATVFTYATYYSCGGGPLARVDEIIADDADRMNGFVEDGTILSWGWLAHHTGGQWQRVSYYQADSMDALLDAGDAIQGGGDDDDAEDAAADDEDYNINERMLPAIFQFARAMPLLFVPPSHIKVNTNKRKRSDRLV